MQSPPNPQHHRSLAAVMFTDMVGYSSMIQRDEALGLELLGEHNALIREVIPKYSGREIDTAGDAFFVAFESALGATQCAIEIQTRFRERNLQEPEERRVLIRIGLHLGDVVHIGDKVQGDGVNIAARMEPLAKPGSICLSEDVARQVHNKIDLPLVRLTQPQLKNIRLPMDAFRVIMPWEDAPDAAGPFERAPETAPATPEPATEKTSGKFKSWHAVVALLVVVAVGWISIWGASETGPPVGDDSLASVVAVLPFSVRGSPNYGYLGAGMVDLLSTKLDGVGDLRAVDARAVLGFVEQSGRETFDPRSGGEIAQQLGAGRFVLGNIVEIGGQLQIDATVYSSFSSQPVEQGSVEGEATGIFDLLDLLATQLVVLDRTGPGSPVESLEQMTTSSFEALKHYLAGVTAFRAALFQEAADELELAVEEDSTFALAWYQLSATAEWLYDAELALHSAEQAVKYSDRLPERGRRLVEALHSSKLGENREALRQYRDFLNRYPDDVEAWYQLSELEFHAAPIHGTPAAESLPSWNRLLFFEPDQITALIHVARIAAVTDDWARFDSISSQVIALEPAAERNIELRAHLELRQPGDKPMGELARLLRDADDDTVTEVIWSLAVFRDDPSYAAALVPFLTDPSRALEARGLGHVIEAYLEMARGRTRAAFDAVDEAQALGYRSAPAHRASLTALPYRTPSVSEIDNALSALRRWTPAPRPPTANRSAWFFIPDGVLPQVKDYLIGILEAERGNGAVAATFVARLESAQAPRQMGSLPSDLANGVRAEIAVRRGDAREAERYLDLIRRRVWYQFGVGLPFASLPRERFRQGETLEQRGAHSEAIESMGSFGGYSLYHWIYTAPSHLRRAASLDALGEQAAAAGHYAEFIRLWSDCDDEFRPMVDAARERLQELRPS